MLHLQALGCVLCALGDFVRACVALRAVAAVPQLLSRFVEGLVPRVQGPLLGQESCGSLYSSM